MKYHFCGFLIMTKTKIRGGGGGGEGKEEVVADISLYLVSIMSILFLPISFFLSLFPSSFLIYFLPTSPNHVSWRQITRALSFILTSAAS